MADALCEQCAYMYIDDDGEQICDINLDEDEMIKFLSSKGGECPYFKYYDEYKMVRKQN